MVLAKIITVLGAILLIPMILIVGVVILKQKGETQLPEEIFLEEKQQIETWIKENNLNQYGDPKETLYIGGTPLFEEKTGKIIDRYNYILNNHPKRPWRK